MITDKAILFFLCKPRGILNSDEGRWNDKRMKHSFNNVDFSKAGSISRHMKFYAETFCFSRLFRSLLVQSRRVNFAIERLECSRTAMKERHENSIRNSFSFKLCVDNVEPDESSSNSFFSFP